MWLETGNTFLTVSPCEDLPKRAFKHCTEKKHNWLIKGTHGSVKIWGSVRSEPDPRWSKLLIIANDVYGHTLVIRSVHLTICNMKLDVLCETQEVCNILDFGWGTMWYAWDWEPVVDVLGKRRPRGIDPFLNEEVSVHDLVLGDGCFDKAEMWNNPWEVAVLRLKVLNKCICEIKQHNRPVQAQCLSMDQSLFFWPFIAPRFP